MNNINNFIETVKKSIYSPSFYQQIPQKTFKEAFGYFFLLYFLVSLVHVSFLLPVFFSLQHQAPKIASEILRAYPKALKLTIKKGQVSTNVKEPYSIPWPDNKTKGRSAQKNFMVIDTKNRFTKEQFKKYDAMSWLTKDALFYVTDDKQTVSVIDLSSVDTVMVDQTNIRGLIDKVSPYFKFITLIFGLLALLSFLVGSIFRLVHIAVIASIIFLIQRIRKEPLDIKNAYKIVLYGVTLALLLEVVFDLIRPFFPVLNILFFFTIVALGTIFINLTRVPKKE